MQMATKLSTSDLEREIDRLNRENALLREVMRDINKVTDRVVDQPRSKLARDIAKAQARS